MGTETKFKIDKKQNVWQNKISAMGQKPTSPKFMGCELYELLVGLNKTLDNCYHLAIKIYALYIVLRIDIDHKELFVSYCRFHKFSRLFIGSVIKKNLSDDKIWIVFWRYTKIKHACACSIQKRFPSQITQLLQETGKQGVWAGTIQIKVSKSFRTLYKLGVIDSSWIFFLHVSDKCFMKYVLIT